MSRDLEFDDRKPDGRDAEHEPQSRMPLSQGRGGTGGNQQPEAPPEFDLIELRERIDRAADGSPSVEAFFDRLEKSGVKPVPSIQSSGRWNGISYEFSGVRVKGSELGRAYTAQGLCQKKGINYDSDRDDAALRAVASRCPAIPRQPRLIEQDPRERPVVAFDAREEQVLWEAGRFRTVAEPDLARTQYGGNHAALQRDLDRLSKLGLIERHTVSIDGRGRTLSVVSLTRKGKAFVKDSPLQNADGQQAIFAGIVKPRELVHDTAIYRMYLAEADKIEAKGGRVKRVVLDYELKKAAYSPMAKAIDLPPVEYAERQQQIAAENGLTVVDGHIVLPDLRIEYETPEGEIRHMDLELVTENYRGAHVGAKGSAGFKMYADGSSSRLAAVLDDHHLIAEILRS